MRGPSMHATERPATGAVAKSPVRPNTTRPGAKKDAPGRWSARHLATTQKEAAR